jgi:hypothetical protein
MKALSIRQPWAWEIVQGFKVVEFRSWKTNIREPILIHASKTIGTKHQEELRLEEERIWLKDIDRDLPDYFDRGGIIGRATLIDCVQRTEPSLVRQIFKKFIDKRPPPGTAPRTDREWFRDLYGFILSDARPLPFVPYPGKQRFFNVPDDLYATDLEF